MMAVASGMTDPHLPGPQSAAVRVLIVDDSSFMRKALTYILKSDEAIDVVGTAVDGKDAIRHVLELHPDVVLLDIQMPDMDGLAALEHIMARHPTPILILTGLYREKPSAVIKALEYGAVDVIAKPSGVISYDIDKIRDEIIYKVKTAATANVREIEPRLSHEPFRSGWHESPAGERMVVIGASTGGPRAIAGILFNLPHNIASAILVIQHLSQDFVPSFADRLKWGCPLDVSIAHKGQIVLPGHVLISPGDCHTMMVREGNVVRVRLSRKPSLYGVYPSIDHAMMSVAEVYGKGVTGVLLTGMGEDGARGMKAIKEAGGCTIAEDPSTCLIFGMPKAAINSGCVDEIVPLPEIPQAILKSIAADEDA